MTSKTYQTGFQLSCLTVILFVHSWSQEYTNIKFCEWDLRLIKNTAVDLNNYMRKVYAAALLRDSEVTGLRSFTVEIYEKFISKKRQ